MLTFNLKKEWFDKIKSGEKTHEYREVKDYWTDRLVKEFFEIDKKKRPHSFIYYKSTIKKLINLVAKILPVGYTECNRVAHCRF